jgi:hypothetical protein
MFAILAVNSRINTMKKLLVVLAVSAVLTAPALAHTEAHQFRDEAHEWIDSGSVFFNHLQGQTKYFSDVANSPRLNSA